MGLRTVPTPAFVVPDEETWMVWGHRLRDRGLMPVADPGRADLLIVPERVPLELCPAVVEAWGQMPAHRRYEGLESPWTGLSSDAVLGGSHEDPEPVGHEAHGGDEHHGHEGHGDHEDMMAIVGEPSRDGLVMESMRIEIGPLSIALPTGLIVSASLDGDLVEQCTIRPSLHAPTGGCDPWAGAAGEAAERFVTWADAGAEGVEWRSALVRLEHERAVSHLGWLHRYLRLLGLRRFGDHARGVLELAVEARDASDQHVVDVRRRATEACGRLARELGRSRGLALRTEGLGVIGRDEVESGGLLGPIARASGSASDRRLDDPLYVACGFAPSTRPEGDARARALLRLDEAAQSLALAATLEKTEAVPDADFSANGTRAAVECPRGPVRVHDGECTVLGAAEAVRAAELAVVGLEWSSALVAIASFDLSPWEIVP